MISPRWFFLSLLLHVSAAVLLIWIFVGSVDLLFEQVEQIASAQEIGARDFQKEEVTKREDKRDPIENNPAATPEPVEATPSLQETAAVPPKAISGGVGGPGSGGSSSAGFQASEDQSSEGNYAAIPAKKINRRPSLNLERLTMSPRLGRRYPERSREEWMIIDSWYVVGPFPNERRAQKDFAFPPESNLSLDAVYPGKSGKQLHWEFVQTSRFVVEPKDPVNDSVYYATTEVFFDHEREIWVALGMDDTLKLWVNGRQVYASGDRINPWSPADAIEKIRFSAGYNRILIRVENGPANVAFSMALHLREG